jgi:hypothetical protein
LPVPLGAPLAMGMLYHHQAMAHTSKPPALGIGQLAKMGAVHHGGARVRVPVACAYGRLACVMHTLCTMTKNTAMLVLIEGMIAEWPSVQTLVITQATALRLALRGGPLRVPKNGRVPAGPLGQECPSVNATCGWGEYADMIPPTLRMRRAAHPLCACLVAACGLPCQRRMAWEAAKFQCKTQHDSIINNPTAKHNCFIIHRSQGD